VNTTLSANFKINKHEGSEPVLPVRVAVGVILREGRVLLAKRPASVHLGGLWEFPGGKVDAGESIDVALIRELKEELDLTLSHENLTYKFRIDWQYSEKQVQLEIYTVLDFSGTAIGAEGQEIAWVEIDDLMNYPLPPANAKIVQWLKSNY